VHVPLVVVLPHVLRQGVHHLLDLPHPRSIADVPSPRMRPPTCAHVGSEFHADRVVRTDVFSWARHHRNQSRQADTRAFAWTSAHQGAKARVPSAARRLRLRRSENGRGGARIGSARRKRDERRADEAQRARDGHALRVRSSVPRVPLGRNAMPDLGERKVRWPRCARTESGRARW
jgi:hypothetical protein